MPLESHFEIQGFCSFLKHLSTEDKKESNYMVNHQG